MLKISERGKNIPESPIRKLVPYAEKAEKEGKKIYRLNIGQPDIKTPEYAIDKIRSFNYDLIPYGHSLGNESYRQKLEIYYKSVGINVNFDDIMVTSGGSEAISFAFICCLNEGDEVIIPEPFYTNYISFATQLGVKIVPLQTSIETDFALPDIAEIEKLVTPKTKAVLICNPNNPTGYVYTKQDLDKLRDVVLKHNLFLISDEVYKEFCFGETQHISVLQYEDIKDHTIMVDSISKRFSCCGVRIGSLVTRNKELHSSINKLAQARLCPPMLGQMAAEAALTESDKYIEEVKKEYLERRDYIIKALNDIEGIYAPMPNGAFYTVVKLPVEDAEDFCKWMLSDFSYQNQTVMMAPASGFYMTDNKGKNEVRIAFVLKTQALKIAVKCLELGLKEYLSR